MGKNKLLWLLNELETAKDTINRTEEVLKEIIREIEE